MPGADDENGAPPTQYGPNPGIIDNTNITEGEGAK